MSVAPELAFPEPERLRCTECACSLDQAPPASSPFCDQCGHASAFHEPATDDAGATAQLPAISALPDADPLPPVYVQAPPPMRTDPGRARRTTRRSRLDVTPTPSRPWIVFGVVAGALLLASLSVGAAAQWRSDVREAKVADARTAADRAERELAAQQRDGVDVRAEIGARTRENAALAQENTAFRSTSLPQSEAKLTTRKDRLAAAQARIAAAERAERTAAAAAGGWR